MPQGGRAHWTLVDFSVVIASIDSSRSIDQCLRHLERSCEGLRAELIVADASDDGTAAKLSTLGGSARLISYPSGTLAPQLWAEGYRQATGRIVGFTTAQCLAAPGWAVALTEALDQGATGAGGPLVIDERTTPLDWALFYLRYAGFMPHTLGSGRVSGEIAGDNAAYRREALDRHTATFAGGFWEVDFHRLVRSEGGWLAAAPRALMACGRSAPVGTLLRQRFVHGRHCGVGRVRGGARAAWQIVLASPLVPFVLAGRSAKRAVLGPAPWRFFAALPWFLLLAGAWAAGEAWGALSGKAGIPATRDPAEC